MEDEDKTKAELIKELKIMKKKQVNRLRDKSEEKYRSLFLAMKEGIYLHEIIYDKSGQAVNYRILEANPASVIHLGIKKEDALNKLATELYGTDQAPFLEIYTKVAETGKTECFETYFPPMKKYFRISVFSPGKGKFATVFTDITEQKENKIKIEYEQNLLHALLDNTSDSIYFKDKKTRFVRVNKTKALHCRSTPEEMIGKTDFDYFSPQIAKKSFQDDMQVLETGKPIIGKAEEIIRLNSTRYWGSVTKVPWYDKKGGIIGIIGITRDISLQKKAEEALRKSQQEFASLFKSGSEALVYVDEDSNIIDINTRFTELFGFTAEEVRGKNINEGLIHPPDKIEEAQDLFQRSLSGNYYNYETVRKKKDGTCFPASISSSTVIIDEQLKGRIISYADITERKKIEKQLKELVRIDPLTGCYNRRYGLELLNRQIKLSQRNQSPTLIGFLDINNFKTINDHFGHQEGDQALKEITYLFQSTLREVDIICRMGGDEFLLVFPDSSLQEAPLIRERLEESLSQLNHKIKKNYQIQFSMGFSEYLPDKPKTLDELIAIADQEMYKEKMDK